MFPSLTRGTPVAQMSTKRRAPVIEVLDGVIYAIGGACLELESSGYLKC